MVSQPLFFLVRPGVTVQTPSGPMQTQPGSIVPLIAIDELPDWIEIVGAPRQLTVQQTIGMANLGSFVKSDGTYPVRIAYDAAGDDSSSDGEEVKPSWADLVEEMRDDCGIGERRDAEIGTASVVPPTPAVSPVQLNTPAPGQPQTPSQPQPSPSNSNNTRATDIHPADRMKAHWAVNQPARHAGLSASIHNQPPEAKQTPPTTQQATTPTISSTCTASTQPMPQSVDEYCRHWCHHGTCKWGLQCRYKHSMPTTPSGLLEVGLSEFPTWWLAKVLIGDTSALALGNKNSSSSSPPSGDINLAAAAAALGMGGLGGLATPYPRQANAQNLGLNLARDYYARQLGVMRGLRLGLGSQGGGVSNKKLKAQLREAVGLLRELGLTTATLPSLKKKEKKAREISPLDRGVKMNESGDVRVQQQQQQQQGDAAGGQVQGQVHGQTQGVQGQVQAQVQTSLAGSEVLGSMLQAQQQAQAQVTQTAHGVNDVMDAKTGSQTSQSQQDGVVVMLPPLHAAATPSAASQSQKLVDV